MKNLFILILALAVQSCSLNSFDQHVEYRVDPLLKPYVDKFYEEAEKRGVELQRVNLIVLLSNEIGSKFGLSEIKNGQKIVSINSYLVDSNEKRLKVIIFHELGHALLNRRHKDTQSSIMNSAPCTSCDFETMLDELYSFTK